MPAALRPKGKATKIAYAILGEPANLATKKTQWQKEMDEKIHTQNTRRIR